MRLDEIQAAAQEAHKTGKSHLRWWENPQHEEIFIAGYFAGAIDMLREHAIIHVDERYEPAHNQLTLEFSDETELVC